MAIAKRMVDRDQLPPADVRRERMVRRQIAGRGIADRLVLDAMRQVPREAFVADELAEFSYDDTPLPISEGQTISQPYVVALTLEAAEPAPGDRLLDVGTGSGYAAAVASRIVKEVVSVERHAALADGARTAIDRLGYSNVDIRVGDGSRGWPDRAPYDAILVAAGGPEVPQDLVDQLATGGRLVIPVGATERQQHLLRLRKTGDGEPVREDLGAVAFVPLIGAGGWDDPQSRSKARRREAAAAGRATAAGAGEIDVPADAATTIARYAEPLPPLDDPGFPELFERVGDARVVLLGEATHGTSQFYRARAAITRRLIEEHGFTMLGIEADWPDAATIDRYVRGLDGRRLDERPFARFPTWMWRNAEMREFVDWLHDRNSGVEPERRVSVHGLDLYSLHASIRAVLDYLDEVDAEAANIARERYGCLSPWQRDPATYGRAALSGSFETCEKPVVDMLRDLLDRRLDYTARDRESFVDAAQNARLVAAAEQYYRAIYYGAEASWNLRDRHMFDTLTTMMTARGPESKAVVWAHNSHIGNAAATEMGVARGEHNIGQLCREEFGRAAALVGFGTDRGTVAAASDWDGPMEIKTVQPALDGSCEALCRDAATAGADVLLDLRPDVHDALRYPLLMPRLHRAIGVIYRPQSELASHYFEVSLPEQFDLYVWLEQTDAVRPLATEHLEGVPETYPFGL